MLRPFRKEESTTRHATLDCGKEKWSCLTGTLTLVVFLRSDHDFEELEDTPVRVDTRVLRDVFC